MELGDEIGKHLLASIKNLKSEEFTIDHAKLLHTLSNYDDRVVEKENDEIV